MKPIILCCAIAAALILGCKPTDALRHGTTTSPPTSAPARQLATEQQAAEIRALIEQLVFDEGQAANEPILTPGITPETEFYRQRYEKCEKAFEKLMEMKALAIPLLVQHLDDKRQSINFRNHYLGNSVGDACYWNICYQLQDRPENYSEYGYQRTGRDGRDHVKPYWQGTPFDEAGGPKQWLEQNKDRTYPQMQVKCLRWLLEKEKAIGACDAESYFVNILPLEVRILERRAEAGEDVASELHRLRRILAEKDISEVPADVLPGG